MRNSFCLRLVVLLVLTLLPLNGCGYPEVSPKTYELSKTLYSVCNQKSEERLEAVQKLIQSALGQNEINEREADWLNGIIAQAQDGNWDTATKEVRQMMEDQIDR